ncbi:hypothetical protein E2C01_093460 [Portunus trituberculatus]|uniref:Uncharacterized protein n=1 Tax=Portunus trituberculatus TaxID=210409 RepID=A0A5B7JYT8_PORTR|nr:hypothetical protein [Portunus trituberculatus]
MLTEQRVAQIKWLKRTLTLHSDRDVIELIESLLKVNPEERPYVDWIVNSVDQLINKSAGAV